MFTKVGKSVQKFAKGCNCGQKLPNKGKSGQKVVKSEQKLVKLGNIGQKWAENGHKVGKSGQKSTLTYGSS